MHAIAASPPPHLKGKTFARVVACLAALILFLQLLGATQHRHDLADRLHDCAACTLAAQLPSPPADPHLAVVPEHPAALQYIHSATPRATPSAGIRVPVPRAQGPPTLFL